jgi:hypothetical protein
MARGEGRLERKVENAMGGAQASTAFKPDGASAGMEQGRPMRSFRSGCSAGAGGLPAGASCAAGAEPGWPGPLLSSAVDAGALQPLARGCRGQAALVHTAYDTASWNKVGGAVVVER